MNTMSLWIAVPLALPFLTIALAWFLHEREHRVLRAGRPFGETTGRHRRREEGWSR